ncbi:MAG: Flp pilus assembly complex ATPase component TadA [Firmicutes bacterium]|nr:Flp pilus assembly complex ATPase component TadA [Bacillota bacterium]
MGEDQVVREVNALNQRGGRMLSIVDLLLAGTVDLRLAAYLMGAVRQGASIICCAGPGGTGKTTLLGALLGLLPESGEIKIVESAKPLEWYDEEWNREVPTWFLCHELGPGPWHSYLWGEGARAFLSMPKQGRFCATTVHADDLGELRRLLMGPEIALAAGDFAKLDLVIFIRALRVQGAIRWQRRVTQVHVGTGESHGTHRLICRWDANTDKFIWSDDSDIGQGAQTDAVADSVGVGSGVGSRSWLPNLGMLTTRARWEQGKGVKGGPSKRSGKELLQRLLDERVLAIEDVRREILKSYGT